MGCKIIVKNQENILRLLIVEDEKQICDMVAKSLYKPQDNPALLHPPSDRSVGFYYLPKGEADKTKAKYLIAFRFMAKNDWKETMLTGIGSTGNDTSVVERDFVSILDHMIQHAAH